MAAHSQTRLAKSIDTPDIHPIYKEYRKVAQHWMLQLLVPLGAQKLLIKNNCCLNDDVLHELGLSHLVDIVPFKGADARKVLQDLYKSASKAPRPAMPGKTQLAKNIDWLANTIGLNLVEKDILHFRVIASRHLTIRACVDNLGTGLDKLFIANVLSNLLGIAEVEIEHALEPGGKLIRSGLITIPSRLDSLIGKIVLLPGLADNLFGVHHDPYSLFQDNFIATHVAKLTKNDYPHLSEDISLLSNYLTESIDKKCTGVNVLIYGTPGSGKTEFVKMLAREIGHPLFEIATESVAGEPIRRTNRFRSYSLSQHILSSNEQRPIILFDEVEDVFRFSEDEEDQKFRSYSGMKGWINKLLEENPVPSFWLSNNIHCLDKAFVRRFDYVSELNTPPRSVRNKILDQYLDGASVSQAWKASMAEHEYLNPAVVERAAKVIETAQQRHPQLCVERSLDRVLGNTLEALGLPRSPKNFAPCETDYRLDILNTDCCITDLCDGLRKHKAGRLCLYGPPGTGKSAFGRYLAESLDQPLMVRRASDILSPYVGVAEQQMAKMFREAAEENAVLLLDEADTFLRDRNGATRGWEVSQVNEMLTQMESFEGVFIASTNLMGSLDAAALRRFDMKVKFDFLNEEQAQKLFMDIAVKFNLEVIDAHRSMLGDLYLLTPGDFANVARQSRFRSISTAKELIARLEAECAAKPESGKRKIGF